MAYELKDESGVRGPLTAEQVSATLSSGQAPVSVRVAGTGTWHDPAHYAELRRSLPTHRPPAPDSSSFVPLAPMKTIACVRTPTASPRLRLAGRERG